MCIQNTGLARSESQTKYFDMDQFGRAQHIIPSNKRIHCVVRKVDYILHGGNATVENWPFMKEKRKTT